MSGPASCCQREICAYLGPDSVHIFQFSIMSFYRTQTRCSHDGTYPHGARAGVPGESLL